MDMDIDTLIWLSLSLYGLLVMFALWKRIAVMHIVALLPLISLITLLGDSALILSFGLAALIVVHILLYTSAIGD